MEGKNLFSLIPKVDELLDKDDIKSLLSSMPRKTVVEAIRTETDKLRESIKKGTLKEEILESIQKIEESIKKTALKLDSYKLKRVINATGVVIHTNLGRSPINMDIMNNIAEIAANYSNLEFDLETGERGSRYSHLEDIITRITGCESAMVVNNNAAAVMLALSTMAKGREVIVSRGELIEIGGSFRVPDVMEQSGARLVEVGTTNKTHLRDYENAINENTAALLKVHTSNYRILGFTSSVDSEELSVLKEKYQVPVIEDLGSGVLIDLSKYGMEYEPTVMDSLNKGVDIVTFSGDKLLGGPQAGIIVGKKEYIDMMKKNPLTRAFRVDKFTIAALEATFKYYLDEEKCITQIPTLKMLTMPLEKLNNKANAFKKCIDDLGIDQYAQVQIENSYSEVGGGSLPLEKLPTRCVVLSLKEMSIHRFEDNLRNLYIPIVARVSKDKVYFDIRTIDEMEFGLAAEGIKHSLAGY